MVSWNEDSTFALIYPWSLYYHLRSRNNLSQQNWETIASFLNTFRGGDETQPNLTVIQCKNRMKFLEATYKSEKQKVMESNGAYTSSWPYFIVMDNFLGPKYMLESPVHSSVLKLSQFMNLRHPTFSDTLRRTSGYVSARNSWLGLDTPMNFPDIPTPSQFRGDLTVFPVAKAFEDSRVSRGESSNHGGKKRKIFTENNNEDYKKASDEAMADLEKTRMECIEELEFVKMKLLSKMDAELDKIRSVSESE